MSDKVPSHYDPLICGWFPYPPRKSKRWQLHAQQTERILTELIAELREQRNYSESEHGFYWRMDRVQEAADRAEARLREVTDE